MKKLLLMSALVLTIVASMVSGTLAAYTVTLNPIASGSAMAKNFKLTGEGEDNFTTDVLIAPSETIYMDFTVSNNDGSITSEVPMDLSISVTFAAATGKSIIVPLTAKVTTIDNATTLSTGSLTNGAGVLSVTDAFGTTAATNTYRVAITWPSAAGDIAYAGHSFGTAVTVSVTGTQA